MGLLETSHIGAQFRLPEPERDLAPEHTALAPIVARARTLARDDKDKSGSLHLRPTQKSQQLGMGSRLALAMEVEAGMDRLNAADEPLLLPALHRLQPLWRFRYWRTPGRNRERRRPGFS
jgi:hypothetical protein